MNITKRVITTVSGAALAGVLIFGAAASASGPDSTSAPASGNHPRIEYICSHQSEITTRLADATTRIDGRTATLTERRAQAVAAGHTVVVARIDKRLERLNTRLDRVTKRATQLPIFVAAHCDPTTPAPASGS